MLLLFAVSLEGCVWTKMSEAKPSISETHPRVPSVVP